MQDFAARLEETGELVDAQALAPDGDWVQYAGEGKARRRSTVRSRRRRTSSPAG